MTPTGPYSILVVEDNQDIVFALQDLLQHDGYLVTVAGTCAEAIAQIGRQRFNVILLDLGLPDGDGLDVLREAQRREASLPVIIITAHIAPERTVGSLAKGAFAYLTKPFNTEELRQHLLRAIGVKALVVKAERAEQSLTESELRFQSLVESTIDAIIVADGRGLIVSWNRAASRMFGHTTEKIIGQPLTVLMPERYRQSHERGLARMEATGESRVIGSVVELHGIRQNGEEFPIELSLASWKSATGSYYSGIIRDISDRKKAAEALAKLQHQHTLILTQAGEGIYGIDVEGNTTFVNPSAASMLRYRVEDLLGRRMHDVLHHTKPDGTPYPASTCPVYAAIHDGQVHRVVDEVFWRKDRTSFPVEYVSTPIREGDHVVGAVIVFRDITDRKLAEEAVHRSKRLLEEVANNTTAVIYAKDLEGRFLFVNRRFEELFKLSITQIIGRTNHEIFPSDIADTFRANDIEVVEKNRAIEYEEFAPQADGLHTYLSIKLPLRDQSGRAYATCGISTDITQRKRNEMALRAHEEQLRLALASTEAGGWDWDAQTGRFYWSRQVDQLLGLTDGSRPRSQAEWLALIHPDDRQNISRSFHQATTDKAVRDVVFEHRIINRNGIIRWCVWTGQIIHDPEGVVLHILGMVGVHSGPKGDHKG